MPEAKYIDLGTIDYKSAWDFQEEKLMQVVKEKKTSNNPKSFILFCEHPHVYTLGRSGQENNLLIKDSFLKSINATYYKINRGGDITYHGPGQIVGYPILDLELLGLGIKSYIAKLEDSIITTLENYGIKGTRLTGATGVWLDVEIPGKARKICAIGVRVSRMVTMHGFALNVNTDLKYFSYINPCGFVDKSVTSMENELGEQVNMVEVKEVLLENLKKEFNITL